LKSSDRISYLETELFSDYIIKWNKACDIMGVKQCLWVLRVEMKFDGSLIYLEPAKWVVLLKKLRFRYTWLKDIGKIDG